MFVTAFSLPQDCPSSACIVPARSVCPLRPAHRPRGRWEDKTSTLPKGWKFFSADESHRRTEEKWAGGPKLTGEVAGRQTWDRTSGDEDEASPGVPEDGEEEEALPTFNPSVNPNSSDKIMRAQQVRKEETKQ